MSKHPLDGAKARALARSLHLVSLLLERPRDRSEVIAALGGALDAVGWQAALRAIANNEDPLPTVARDLAMLRDLDLIRFLGERPYRAEPGANLPLWMTPEEAQGLTLARLALEQLGVPEVDLLDSLLARVPTAIRRSGARRALALAPSMPIGVPSVWETIQDGLARGRQMRLTYRKAGGEEAQTFVIDRARLAWISHAFYLLAYRPSYAAEHPDWPAWRCVRDYRLDRIEGVEVLDAAVALAELPDFTCVFVLSPEMRDRVTPLQDAEGRLALGVEPLADGSVRVRMRENSLLRARQRLSLYGEHLVAIESPGELEAEFTRSLAKLASRFLP